MQCFDEDLGVYQHEALNSSRFFLIVGDDVISKYNLEWHLIQFCDSKGKKLKTAHICYLCLKCGYVFRNSEDVNIVDAKFSEHAKINHEKSESKQITLHQLLNKEKSVHVQSMPTDLLILLIQFISKARVSLVQGSSDPLYALIWSAMRLAQKHPNTPVEKLFVRYTRQTLSVAIHILGGKLKESVLRLLKKEKVSIMMNGGLCFLSFFFFFLNLLVGRWKFVVVLIVSAKIKSIIYWLYMGPTYYEGYWLKLLWS
jgi:hypothetical protein